MKSMRKTSNERVPKPTENELSPNGSHKSSYFKNELEKTLPQNKETKRASKGHLPGHFETGPAPPPPPGQHFGLAGRDLGRGVCKETRLGTLVCHAVHLDGAAVAFGAKMEPRRGRVDCIGGRFWRDQKNMIGQINQN